MVHRVPSKNRDNKITSQAADSTSLISTNFIQMNDDRVYEPCQSFDDLMQRLTLITKEPLDEAVSER